MRRENLESQTGILQVFNINKYRRWYLPFPVWFIGWLLSFWCPPIIGNMFWTDIFTVEGVTL